MTHATSSAGLAIVIGLAMIAIGWRTRDRGGRPYLFLGAAFVAGPLSPLLAGYAGDSARVTLSVTAILLTAAGVMQALLSRQRTR